MIIVFFTARRGKPIEAMIVFGLEGRGSFIIFNVTLSLAFPPTFFLFRSKYLNLANVPLKF